MTFQFGIDQLLDDPKLISRLASARVALVGHPASVTQDGSHSMDALIKAGITLERAFGPQHGMRGDKQDNMIESSDFLDPIHAVPVISLYSEHRRPTPEMLHDLDIVLFDLQDIGCRIYTYIATLKYFLEACGPLDVEVWILDRPNPAGRPIDGLYLEPGAESFVGCDELPTRHGLTTGELARWFVDKNKLETDIEVIEMLDYQPDAAPGYGWPTEMPWINPSPNASSLNMARCFAGTVLLEGTLLSEGRGTTVPLEIIGGPGFPSQQVIDKLLAEVPHWIEGVLLRSCFFEPTFHKHQGLLCAGIQIHTGTPNYDHARFQPYRLIAGMLKACHQLNPQQAIWRDFYYEYENNRIAIDVINGGSTLRTWVEDHDAELASLDALLQPDIDRWQNERANYLIYP